MATPTGSSKGDRRGQQTARVRTLVDFATERLRESILSGDLPADERFRLAILADELGMSPIPLREALRTLATEGLVIPLAHRGYTVAPTTIENFEDTYRLRLMLEPEAVRLAVPQLDRRSIEYLAEELDLLEVAFRDTDWVQHRIHHRAFHFGIYSRCSSPWLVRFTEMLWLNAQRYQRMTTRIEGELGRRGQEHRRILAACAKQDSNKASLLMREHLSRAGVKIRAFLVETTTTATIDGDRDALSGHALSDNNI